MVVDRCGETGGRAQIPGAAYLPQVWRGRRLVRPRREAWWKELPDRMTGAVTFQHRVQPARGPEMGN